jgi:hypothetical protein
VVLAENFENFKKQPYYTTKSHVLKHLPKLFSGVEQWALELKLNVEHKLE